MQAGTGYANYTRTNILQSYLTYFIRVYSVITPSYHINH